MRVSPLLKFSYTEIIETGSYFVSYDFWKLQNEVPDLSEEL